MFALWGYSLLSVLLVSLISLLGILTLAVKGKHFEKYLLLMVAFSAGALFGDAFIHLLPEVVEEYGFGLDVSIYVLVGVAFSFLIEKVLHWRHCHHPTSDGHPHPFAVMNLVGDAVHNFIDGLIIGIAYLVSIPVGIATTVAIVFHEIPQEVGDFSVLVHGGFSRKKALWMNFAISLLSVVGVVLALVVGQSVEGFIVFLLPFAAGNFIYIAGSDLIPEVHKETDTNQSIMHFFLFLIGILTMLALVYLEA